MSIKKIVIFLFTVFLITFNYSIIANDYKPKCYNKILNPDKRELKIGEHFLYRVELFGVPIAWINLNVKEKIIFEGHPCYHLNAQAYTNRFFKKIYDVEYNVDAYIDSETFLPYRFKKQRRLKQEITETKVDFDWIKKQAIILNDVSKEIVNLDDRCQDILSSIYYFRLMNIESDRSYNLKIFYGQKSWQINIKPNSIHNLDIYRLGSFEVFETEIITELSQVILGTPKITVYFLNDKERIPLIFFLRIPLGHLKGRIYNPIN